MAAVRCKEIISSSFPSVDSEISEYIDGVIDLGVEDFESTDDVYDAIGGMLLGVSEKDEDEIKDICERLYAVMKNEGNANSKGHIKLDAPIHLGELVGQKEKESEGAGSIWLAKKESVSKIDQKKLDKAEQKIKAKEERRSKQTTVKPNNIMTNTASASQQINRKESKMDADGTNRSTDIKIENFDVSFGDLVLLKEADLMMSFGRRYGLVGRNGIGKTTLLRMIATGSLRIASHISVLHVEQEVVGDDTAATQSVLECDTKRETLLKEEREISAQLNSSSPQAGDHSLSTRLSKIYQELEHIEADKAPAKVGMILAGLGFTPDMQKMPTKEFSGGWRMRLALARALFSQPDLLLLDEPTNMLDMKAIIWLENYLQNWPTTILVVSHDRQFLNMVTTDILHLHTRRIDAYKGDYEVFVKSRMEKLKNQQREYESQMEYRQHIQVFIDRFRYNANRAAQVQSKLKLLEKLPELKPLEKETEVVLKFPECEELSAPILMLDECKFYYTKEKPLFHNVCIGAGMHSRICIVGENGAGKTTLLKILLGTLDPVFGVRHAHRNLRIGYFSQHHVDQLEMNQNSVEVMAAKFPGHNAEYYRGKLGKFGVSGDLALRPVISLSGGQKSRVAFAVMSLSNPNFLVLDEPTNHLDMETIEALGAALNKFKGGVILVSHDERLIRSICTELWVCSNQQVKSLEGGIEEYKKLVQMELASQS